jgi:hypothetical protein
MVDGGRGDRVGVGQVASCERCWSRAAGPGRPARPARPRPAHQRPPAAGRRVGPGRWLFHRPAPLRPGGRQGQQLPGQPGGPAGRDGPGKARKDAPCTSNHSQAPDAASGCLVRLWAERPIRSDKLSHSEVVALRPSRLLSRRWSVPGVDRNPWSPWSSCHRSPTHPRQNEPGQEGRVRPQPTAVKIGTRFSARRGLLTTVRP